MVRIRIKITRHDGTPMKPLLIRSLCDAEVFINKIIENKEAAFVITDNKVMDTLLRDENRQLFIARRLDIQYPPEYEAARTVLLRNVDSAISALTEQEIARYIKELNVKRVIKIPNSEHLLKIVFNNTQDADKAVQDGLQIKYQKFQNRSIEKEAFVPVVPCYRCYSYKHQKRNCPKSDQYKICSNCAGEDHIYNDCNAEFFKCINCGQNHRTLATKCPIRKDIIRTKIRERRARSQSAERGETTHPVTSHDAIKAHKLPENYLAVMAATITLADKRETEVPGIFTYIMDQMLKANDIPEVVFPDSVIRNYKENMEKEKSESESRKRQRSEEGGRDSVVSYTIPEGTEYAFMPDSTLQLVKKGTMSPYYVPTPTPASSLRSTPTTTPLPTPVSSLQRAQGAVPKRFKEQPKQQRATQQSKEQKTIQLPKEQRVTPQPQEQREIKPGLLLITRTDVVLPENINNQQLKKDAIRDKIIKYVYTNPAFKDEEVKKNLMAGKYDLTQVRRLNIALENFHQINNGGICKLDTVGKLERK